MEENMELELWNTQAEIIVLGSLWANSDSFAFDYYDIIGNNDFHDGACKFYHALLNEYINGYSTEVSEAKVNMFVSQNPMMMSGYKKFGYFKAIKDFMRYAVNSTEEMKLQVDVIKKWSVLRALQKDGYEVEKILSHPKFNSFTAEQTVSLIRGKIDKICNNTLSNLDDPILLTDNAIETANNYLLEPERGYNLCWQFANNAFAGGVKSDTLGIAGLSNSAKGRMLTYILMHLFCCEKLNVGLISNEMIAESMKACALVTLCNANAIKQLHGEDLNIEQKRFVSGWYKNSNGEIVKRKMDSNGAWTETIDQFKDRLMIESSEYRSVMNALKWFEDRQQSGQGKFLFKSVSAGYTDEIVCRTIRQLVLQKKTDVWAYDTCKTRSDGDIGNYADLVSTVSKFSELNKSLNSYAILTLQLNNGALDRPIEDIDASNLANASYVYQLLDELIAFKHLSIDEYDNYIVKTKDGSIELDKNAHLTAIKVLKNRRGEKNTFLLNSDLNKNTWNEVSPNGILLPKPKKQRQNVMW